MTVIFKIEFLIFKTLVEFHTALVQLSNAFFIRKQNNNLNKSWCVMLELAKDEDCKTQIHPCDEGSYL